MSTLHIADTGLFVAMGQPSNSRFQAVRQFARRNDITFVLPKRVYEELTPDSSTTRTTPVETAIDEGWATVANLLTFSRPVVSRVMDGVQRYIANADGRPADEVERADAALAALAVQELSAGAADDLSARASGGRFESPSVGVQHVRSRTHGSCALTHAR